MQNDNVNSKSADNNLYLHLLPIIVCFSFAVFVLGITSVQFGNAIGFVGVFSFAAVIFAVIQLGAMWAVLGPGKYWKSAGLSFAACAVPGFTSLISLAIVYGSSEISDIVPLSGFAPITWVMAQLPYWYLRLFFDWRITHNQCSIQERVSISELLIFTAFFAISLALLRAAFSIDSFSSERQQEEIVFRFLFPCLVFLMITFVGVCLPAMKFCFVETSTAINSNRISWLIVAMFVFVVVGVALGALFGSFHLATAIFWVLLLFTFAFTFPLCFHRKHGFFIAKRRPKP